MNYGTVTFSAHLATGDTASDLGPEPDIVPITGYVDFIPSVLVNYASSSGLLVIGTVTAGIDENGVMRDAEGNPSITLIASDSPELSRQHWTYEAYIRVTGVDSPIGPYYFVLHSGENHDLGLDAPAEMSNGIAILRGPAGPAGPPGPAGASGGAVDSVNSKTGAVVLNASDVGVQDATAGIKGLLQLAGDLGGSASAPTVPNRLFPILNDANADPARPNTQATAVWLCPDADRPATNGSKSGGAYAAAPWDLMVTWT